MGVLALWPLALLVLVPVIIILYILRQEARKQKFSSLMFWEEAYRNNEAAKPWEKLKRNLLLLLQILAVLLLIFALMGPWIRAKSSERRQAILVVDNSGSMSAEYQEGISRLEAAREAAKECVRNLPDGTTIHIISCDRQAVLVFGGSTDVSEACRRIDSIEETALPGDLTSSLGLVRSCASQSKEPNIFFFTDTAFDMGDLNASVVAVSGEGKNIAVTQTAAVWKEAALEVLVLLENGSTESAQTEINLYGIDEDGKERLLEIGSARMRAGDLASVYLEIPAGKVEGIWALRAEINEPDALDMDNSAWCVLGDSHSSKVLLLSKSNLFLEKSIGSFAGIELVRTDDPEVVKSGYDLYIFDKMLPEELPESGNFLFLDCEEDTYAPALETVKNRLLTIEEGAAGAYIDGTQIGVNRTFVYELPAWATGFCDAGGGACAGYYGTYDGHRTAVLGFDLHETDFGLMAEFPILMSNLCDYLTGESLTDALSYTAGDGVLLHGSLRGSELVLALPDGEKETLPAAEAAGSYLQVEQMGVYRVEQTVDENVRKQLFAVNFPTDRESWVESAKEIRAASTGTAGAAAYGKTAGELREIILWILLVLLLVEWLVYLRQK